MEQYISLNNGMLASAKCLHIRSIPHLSLLGDGTLTPGNNAFVVDEYKCEMASLLAQVHQYMCDRKSLGSQMAIEVIWVTKPIKRQTYKACIELYIAVHAMERDVQQLNRTLDTLMQFCRSSLQMQWFEVDFVPIEELSSLLTSVIGNKIRAVIKEERIEQLPIRGVQPTYAFDEIVPTSGDFHQLAATMTDYPNSAVLFQLLPTEYTEHEKAYLLQQSQVLNSLGDGIQNEQMGKISIVQAQKLAKTYSQYAEERNRPVFQTNILVQGSDEAITALSAVTARLFNNGASRAIVNSSFIDLDIKPFRLSSETLYSMPWMTNRSIAIEAEHKINFTATTRLRHLSMLFPIAECTEFFGLPFANNKIAAGMRVNETGKKSRSYADGIINSGDISIGELKTSPGDILGISLKDLAKHMLVVGTPGSGKTTFSIGLLDRLWKEHKIPFLVIEPAKNEYRALIQSIPELQVFTPGKQNISPFVFNPFVPPANVRLEAYKSSLKTAFAAGVTMTSPLDKIFEDSVNACYSDFRWLDSYTIADKGRIFNINDFIKAFQNVFDSIGYRGDAQNIGRAGIVRLKGLISLFDNYFSIPIADILSRPTVIELAAIENADEKALIIALLLLSVLSYVNANYVGEGGLKNFILLEEAHVLLDNESGGGDGAANPAAIAQGLVKRMLAEIRSYGVGIAIADQSPRKVGIDIVALTDIKVAFRLVEAQDKQIIADSTGMDEKQISRLGKLKPGEAFFFFNKLEEPEEVVTPDYRLSNKISISLSDEGIAKSSTYWNDKQLLLRPYPWCSIVPTCQKNCDYLTRLLAREVARRISNKIGSQKEKLYNAIARLSNEIREQLNDEPLTPRLKACVKVHLFRKLKYESSLEIKDEIYENSLKKPV